MDSWTREIAPHKFEPDIDEEGRVLFTFSRLGGYVPCVHCDRDRPNDIHICGVDFSPEDEPGHYICPEKEDSKYPHCMKCHQHHVRGADCELVAEMKDIDERMLGWAQ